MAKMILVTLKEGRFSNGSLELLAALTIATRAFIFFSISSLSRFFSAALELGFAFPMFSFDELDFASE